jgi:hypothetical protein
MPRRGACCIVSGVAAIRARLVFKRRLQSPKCSIIAGYN